MKKMKIYKKRFLTGVAMLSLFLGVTSGLFAETEIKSGTTFTVMPGSNLVVMGNLTIETGATLTNDGTLLMKGTTFTNNGVPALGTGEIVYTGSSAQAIAGASNSSYQDLTIDNATGVAFTGSATDVAVNGILDLTSGTFGLGSTDLTAASIANAASGQHIVTNGIGSLIQTVALLGSVDFPVGISASEYSPITVANPDVAGDVSIRVKDDLEICGTGSQITEDVVTLSWNVVPAAATAADVTLNWDAAQEGLNFDNTNCGIIYCNGNNYELATALGDNSSYTVTGLSLANFGWLGIGDDAFDVGFLLANAKVYLMGPYNSGSMGTALNTAGLIPADQPYSNANYNGTHLDYDGTETNASIPATVVDWVLVELRTGTAAATTVETVAAFVLGNGNIVSYKDGVSDVEFETAAEGNYYVVVHHRNHLSIMTASTLALTKGSATQYDFTTAMAQAYTSGSNPMNDNGDGTYSMFAGDASNNNDISADDETLWKTENGLTNIYTDTDFTVNADVSADDETMWKSTNGFVSQVPN